MGRRIVPCVLLVAACAPDHERTKLHDSGAVEAVTDAAAHDAAAQDAAAPDAGADASLLASSCERSAPAVEGESLSAAAVFSDAEFQHVHACFRKLEPAYPLWSDGLVATRYLYLPSGSKIDGHDLEHFRFPVGTRALKLYSTAEGRPVELRVIEHGAEGFHFGSYVYMPDGKHASYTELGGADLLGLKPRHDIPSEAQCNRCHGGEPGRLLGVSAFQLGRGGEPSLETLVHEGVLDLPALDTVVPAFADPVTEAALGALHVNCGHCHSDSGEQSMLDYVLRVEADATDPEKTRLYTTNMNITLDSFSTDGVTLRIKPGDETLSGTFLRAAARDATQMPDIATHLRNLQLEDQVRTWIRSLSP